MAKVGNECKLILNLARERKIRESRMEPESFKRNEELHEAYNMGLSEGQRHYEGILDDIVNELERK